MGAILIHWPYVPAILSALLFPVFLCNRLNREFRMHKRGLRYCYIFSYLASFTIFGLLVFLMKAM